VANRVKQLVNCRKMGHCPGGQAKFQVVASRCQALFFSGFAVSSFVFCFMSESGFAVSEEDSALAKVARLLRPRGWWAIVSNVFGDSSRPDPFHEATRMLLNGPRGPSAVTHGIPFALDSTAPVEALRRTGAFDLIEHRSHAWMLELDADQTVALYATFSEINARQDRQTVLTELRRIAHDEFQDRVTRNMTTSLYIARRCTRRGGRTCIARTSIARSSPWLDEHYDKQSTKEWAVPRSATD
jgi:hypothetical protein